MKRRSERASRGTTGTKRLRDTSTDPIAGAWFDRDLGWLEFNRRVLAEALDERTPLLERVKFLAIFDSNLDEFFMKRLAAVREYPASKRQHLIGQIRERLMVMLRQQSDCFTDRIVPELAREGIHVSRWESLTSGQREEACDLFDTQISSALTPLVIHPTQPFPFFANGSLSLTFVVHDERRATPLTRGSRCRRKSISGCS